MSGILRILTWQEIMKEFEIRSLIKAIRCLLDSSNLLPELQRENVSSRGTGVLTVLREQVRDLATCCGDATLEVSTQAVNDLDTLLQLSEGAIAESLADAVKRTIVIIERELSACLFLRLEPIEKKLYLEPWKKWEVITKRFGETMRDIEEMNKCFALTRYPAAMFHALHVAEWGAIKLGDYIGVADPKKGWGPTERKLREIIKAGHANVPPALAGKFDFLEQMNREIDSIVLAWRHKVDHAANHLAVLPNMEFTQEIAEHIISSVRVFMNRLAEGIPE